jgi:hypothetical protein
MTGRIIGVAMMMAFVFGLIAFDAAWHGESVGQALLASFGLIAATVFILFWMTAAIMLIVGDWPRRK